MVNEMAISLREKNECHILVEKIGLDVLSCIFQFLFPLLSIHRRKDANLTERESPSKEMRAELKEWNKIQRVCKEWKQTSWELMDFSFCQQYPLFNSSRLGLSMALRKLLKEDRCDPTSRHGHIYSAAAVKGNLSALVQLVEDKRFDPLGEGGNSSMMVASHYGQCKILELLISKGCNAFIGNGYPLLTSCEHGYLESVKLLVKVEGMEKYLNEALICAAPHYEIVEFLLTSTCADPTFRNNAAITAATYRPQFSKTRLLLLEHAKEKRARISYKLE
eukprot:TRINITY_DN1663_c0_g1_i1.p1 TRINITY_DN1663_c0_g1~~TRINITY_DN1663_c0_g1_i1.p1  ORF type:complete len:277 (-),score=73.78 TRINITY_DN1663_c0_g1_i1:28-858(-)